MKRFKQIAVLAMTVMLAVACLGFVAESECVAQQCNIQSNNNVSASSSAALQQQALQAQLLLLQQQASQRTAAATASTFVPQRQLVQVPVAQPQVFLSAPVVSAPVAAPAVSASASASTAAIPAPALSAATLLQIPTVSAAPVLAVGSNGCSSGACGRRGGGLLRRLLPTSRSVAVTRGG